MIGRARRQLLRLVLRANRGTGCYRGHRSDSRKWGFNGRVALQKSLAVHVGLGSESVIPRCRLNVRIAPESGRRGDIGARLEGAVPPFT